MEKIKSKRVINLLIFTSFFSFFIVGVSQLMLFYSVSIEFFLTDTFLEPIINFVSGFVGFFFKILKYFGIATLISSLVSLFIIFYQDFVKGSSIYKI